ncbi:MAG: glycosyltransferase [Candidatus Omnitrophota bacterium]
MGIKTSIVIPVCNQAGYSRICLDYLVRTGGAEFELVVVDNGSTDGTGALFRSLKKPVNVSYIRNSRNLGPIIALNQGVKAATGDIVCTMHNDLVVFEAGWLVKLARFISDRGEIGLVGIAGRRRIDRKGRVDEDSLLHNLQNENLNAPMSADWGEAAVLDGVLIAGKKTVFENIGCFDEQYGFMHYYDLDISLRSRRAGYKNAVLKIESLHINNGGLTRKTPEYKRVVPDDTALLNRNSALFFDKWKKYLPIEIS